MRVDMYSTPEDIARAFFEIIYILMLFYHIAVSGITLTRKYKSYNIWQERFYEILTEN